jgi:cbb3-type cytochrome oxidase maturation protein
MEALYLLIPLSVLIVFFAIWVFFKASDSGQFDDLVGPGMRILQDENSLESKETDQSHSLPSGHPTKFDSGQGTLPR